jgi:prepilin-type N-terminal cleavage/methylation domain-containing protein
LRGFTLIEVLVSVMILVIASIAFFNVTGSSYKLFEIFEKKMEFDLKASISLVEEKGGVLKDIVDFDIKNDEILKALKIKVNFEKKTDFRRDFNNTDIVLYKLKAFDKQHSKTVYSLEVK